MVDCTIVDYCSDIDVFNRLKYSDDVLMAAYENDDEGFSVIYIKGKLGWATMESLLMDRNIVSDSGQIINMGTRTFESVEELERDAKYLEIPVI